MRIPILRLGKILLTSIQSDITDEQALALQTDLLTQLEKSQAIGVVLDISALDVVDSYMARILSDTARMARLMGGEVVIAGMHPMVAVALIEMGRELTGAMTALNLELGVQKLQQKLIERGDTSGEDIGYDNR